MKYLSVHRKHKGRLGSFALLLILLMSSLLAGGCGPKQRNMADPIQRVSPESSYVPEDDGNPLSSTELAVLNSTGQIDKKISDKGMQDVTVQYKHYIRKGRITVERFSKRAEQYLTHSRKAFKDRGMPEELAYLAIVESGYNPLALSPAGAAGAWQFMPFTGTKYGLEQDWWVDERRDPYKSAEAAADYLKKLYGDFNDWHLAIAAYNAGEGKIGRALDKTGTVTFFRLTEKNHTLDDKAQLREETKQYVPRFLAICKIMRNLEKLGFDPIDVNRAQIIARLEVRPGTDLMALSRAVGMEWSEFHSYNAAFKRYVSPTDRSSVVYLPQTRREKALAYLKNPSATSYAGWQCYPVAKGDTWRKISQRCAVPVSVLQSANKNVGSLTVGTVVMLPGSDSLKTPPVRDPSRDRGTVIVSAPTAASRIASADTGKTRGKNAPAAQNVVYGRHTLQAGDTLSRVSNLYKVSVQELLTHNDIDDPQRIRQGQVLRIPLNGDAPVAQSIASTKQSAVAAAPAATVRPVTMSVTFVSKDSKPSKNTASQPQNSAKSATVAKAEAVHGSSGSLGRASSTSAKKKQATYVVQAGDTLWGIARKHNVQTKDLLEWNKSDGKAPLRPGDTLVLLND